MATGGSLMSARAIVWSESEHWPNGEEARSVWLMAIATVYGKRIDRLEYHLVSDLELLGINETHLQHHDWTDIITFDYGKGSRVRGEIYISWDRVCENAGLYGQSQTKELLRVIAHGLLHLCGLKDKSSEEKKQMRKAEEWALQQYDKVSRGT